MTDATERGGSDRLPPLHLQHKRKGGDLKKREKREKGVPSATKLMQINEKVKNSSIRLTF